jgi:signal transduction histidine kinase
MTSIFAVSQQAKIDSVLNIIETTNDDSTKYDLVNRIGFNYIFRDPDKFIPFARRHLKGSKDDEFKLGTANILNNIGIYYDVQGFRDSSELYFNNALTYSRENKLHNVHSKALNNLGMFHWNKGEFDPALEYFFEALKLLNETETNEENRQKFEAKYRSNIGLIYQEMGLYNKSIGSHHIALDIRENYNMRTELPTSYTNLGICHRNLENRDSAFYYLQKSLDVALEQELFKEQKLAHDNLGNLYQDAGEKNEAIFHYKESLGIGKEIPNTGNSDIISLGNLIHLYNDQGSWAESLKALDQASQIMEEDPNAKNFAKDVYKNGAITYFHTGRVEKGEEYLNRFIVAKDSTFASENADKMAEYEAKFDTQDKERELLEEQNKTQELTLENVKSEQKLASQKNTIYLLIIGILVVVLFTYFIYLRKKQRMESQRVAIEIKAKEENVKNVIEAQEKERERLARELHDGLVQEIRLMKGELEQADFTDQKDRETLSERIASLKEDARNLAYAIMPSALSKTGLIEASRDLINNSFSDDIKASFFSAQDHLDVPDQVKTNMYRILQEAINNIIKHSEAKEVDVSINLLNAILIVTIEDEGIGFDTSNETGSIGMKSMESRAQIMNGSLEIESSENGTILTLRVPLS